MRVDTLAGIPASLLLEWDGRSAGAVAGGTDLAANPIGRMSRLVVNRLRHLEKGFTVRQRGRMSVPGTKRTSRDVRSLVAIGGKADKARLRAPTSEFDLGGVKTQKIETSRELYFSVRFPS